MEECRNQQHKSTQQRMVRIVSCFLVNQIKTKTINFNTDIILNIEKFCVEFNQVKEANELYRIIRSENY